MAPAPLLSSSPRCSLPALLLLLIIASSVLFIAIGRSRSDTQSTHLAHPASRPRTPVRLPTSNGMMRGIPTRSPRSEKDALSKGPRWISRLRDNTKGVMTQMNGMAMGKVPAAIIALQSVGLVGATVTGYLAARRRDEIKALNDQLRNINAELRSRENALLEKDAVISYVEKRADANGAGDDDMDPEEQKVYALIDEGNSDIGKGNESEGIEKLSLALLTADKLQNKRFSVNARRALAGGYQKIGEYDEALKSLLTAFHLAAGYPEAVHSRVALTGEIADLYTDMGELKKAAEYYDMWLAGM